MRRTGFTLIEVLITITILTVLLIVAVTLMRGSEANARDNERTTDINTLAQQLDSYYTSGTQGSTTVGRYPGLDDMSTEANVKSTLRDLDWRALRAPGVSTASPMSIAGAANNSTTQTPSTSTYLYQPLDNNGALCTTTASNCRKYNLYYQLESSGTIQVLASRYQ